MKNDKILMILKTNNLSKDQRVLKEIESLQEIDFFSTLLVAHNDTTNSKKYSFPIHSIKLYGGATPKKTVIRVIGASQFYFKAIKYILKNKHNYLWVNDPIMFPLIVMARTLKPSIKIIWDHHELPPEWFLNSLFFKYIFKLSYRYSDIVIHANKPRKEYLESILKFKHKSSYILSNYPKINSCLSFEVTLPKDAETWIQEGKFIYIQNSLQENRFGHIIINAAIELGYKVIHAGKIDYEYIEKYGLKSKNVLFTGYLEPYQINKLLNYCELTVILYKQNSYNQKYCDANRLYQAMYFGTPLIIGNNPPLVDATQGYNLVEIVDTINKSSLKKAIINITEKKNCVNKSPTRLDWAEYDRYFKVFKQELLGSD